MRRSDFFIIELPTHIISYWFFEAKEQNKLKLVFIKTDKVSFITLIWKGFRTAKAIVLGQQWVTDMVWDLNSLGKFRASWAGLNYGVGKPDLFCQPATLQDD